MLKVGVCSLTPTYLPEQTWAYWDRCGAESAHLVIFDRDEQRPWREKIFHRTETYNSVPIQVWGM